MLPMYRISILFWMCGSLLSAQLKAPFWSYDFKNDKTYQERWAGLDQKNISPEILEQWIEDARAHKDWEQVISLINKKPENELNSRDFFLLGAANGFRSREVNRMFSLPYVRNMKTYFGKAHQANPTGVLTLVALYKVYSDLPSLLGGSRSAAMEYVNALKPLDPLEYQLGLMYVSEAFEGLVDTGQLNEFLNQCAESSSCDPLPENLKQKRRNFIFDVLRLVAVYNSTGACVEPFIVFLLETHSSTDSFSSAWIKLYAAVIAEHSNQPNKALQWIEEVLEEAPEIEEAQELKRQLIKRSQK